MKDIAAYLDLSIPPYDSKRHRSGGLTAYLTTSPADDCARLKTHGANIGHPMRVDSTQRTPENG
jgi:hypothetical protein